MILNVIAKFSTAYSEFIDGRFVKETARELIGGSRLNYIFYEVFNKTLLKVDPFDALTDEDKKKTTEGKVKELETNEEIGVKKISKIEGEKVNFEGAEFTKLTSDILMKVGATTVEGQEDLTNTLKELKGKNADAIQKMDDIAKIFMDPEANKEKIEEIEKIIGGA
jgi:hypothetical protein